MNLYENLLDRVIQKISQRKEPNVNEGAKAVHNIPNADYEKIIPVDGVHSKFPITHSEDGVEHKIRASDYDGSLHQNHTFKLSSGKHAIVGISHGYGEDHYGNGFHHSLFKSPLTSEKVKKLNPHLSDDEASTVFSKVINHTLPEDKYRKLPYPTLKY